MTVEQFEKLKPGDKVHYTANPQRGIENGIFKDYASHMQGAFVVYNCQGDWDNYKNYTAANTNFSDLELGWKDNAINHN